ncbi:UDP-N-acetylglucosamine 2-epimerase (non-hydrolyzing), partial [Escherichia coli]|nr:UDP-N-acetylglucosamine 2-epimerase (non-hydrolyzing) [Escherichia coli]
KPDVVMVYGDTNSTLAGAIAASKLHINVAHVEAGLRSFNMSMPEEINRILTDRVSSLLFCPTRAAMDNLEKEGIRSWGNGVNAILSGDVMQDGALFYKKFAQKPSNLDLADDFILCTIHRAENTDVSERLVSIIDALTEIAMTRQVVLPLHPRTKKVILSQNIDISKLTIIEPVGYLNMVWLISNCAIVMTDSGGLQKEAFFFSKPCLTLRDETEWVELVENGFNILVGANKQSILNAYTNCVNINTDYLGGDLYGNGKASKKIV